MKSLSLENSRRFLEIKEELERCRKTFAEERAAKEKLEKRMEAMREEAAAAKRRSKYGLILLAALLFIFLCIRPAQTCLENFQFF